jgi:hypothetical protein
MKGDISSNDTLERRSKPRTICDQYRSVEFSPSKTGPVYQFRIRDISSPGIGIMIKEESAALKYMKVGDVLKMKYNPMNSSDSPQYLETEIIHITKLDDGQFKGNCLAGLLVLEKQDADSETDV